MHTEPIESVPGLVAPPPQLIENPEREKALLRAQSHEIAKRLEESGKWDVSTAEPAAPALSDPNPAPSPKLYTLADIDASSPFSPAVTWANLAVLIQAADEVHVHFRGYKTPSIARDEPHEGRAVRVEKSVALGRALGAAVRHGNNEFVRVYTMGARILCFGM